MALLIIKRSCPTSQLRLGEPSYSCKETAVISACQQCFTGSPVVQRDFSLLISKNIIHITPVNVCWIGPSLFHTLMVLSAEPVIMSPEVSWMADQTALWCPDNVIKGLGVPSNFHTQAVSSHEALNTVFSFKPAARLQTAMKKQYFWLVNIQVDELGMTE